MKVMVTGATGFIGQQLCSTLVARGYEVIPILRSGAAEDGVSVGDIGPETDWREALATEPDVIVHLAARVHVMKETLADALETFRRVNVAGSLNLARQALAAGVKRLVFLSSIKVNGDINLPDRPFRADDTPAPEDAYAISKTEAEKSLQEFAQVTGLELVVIRPPLVYGPGVKGNFASMRQWLIRGVPLPLGAIHNSRSLIALENLVDFVVLCADRERSPHANNEVFLISDGENISTTELLRRVARVYGVRAYLVPVPVGWLRICARICGKTALADRLLGSLVVDSSKAQKLLGWQPVVTMDNQLLSMTKHDART